MKPHAYHIILFLLMGLTAQGQVGKLSERQRKEQRAFILNDTLPVLVEALPDEVNTHFSEYCGRLLPDSTCFFTSMRANAEEDLDHIFETSWYCNIYQSKLLPDGNYAPAEALPVNINSLKFFNSNFFSTKNRTCSSIRVARATMTATCGARCGNVLEKGTFGRNPKSCQPPSMRRDPPPYSPFWWKQTT